MGINERDEGMKRLELGDAFSSGVVDRVTWERLVELDRGSGSQHLHNLILQLRTVGTDHLRNVEVAIASQRWSDLQREIHSLRSATCYFGAARFSRACLKLQGLAETGSTSDGLEEALAEISGEFDRLVSALHSLTDF